MTSRALAYPALYRRRRARALFLRATTQQVQSVSAAREVVRAVLALGGVAAWGGLALLLAG